MTLFIPLWLIKAALVVFVADFVAAMVYYKVWEG